MLELSGADAAQGLRRRAVDMGDELAKKRPVRNIGTGSCVKT